MTAEEAQAHAEFERMRRAVYADEGAAFKRALAAAAAAAGDDEDEDDA
jgi:hypothetical protein